MYDSSHSARARSNFGYRPANWEADVQDVVVETCGEEEDPSGFRVIFYTNEVDLVHEDENSYSIGASYLQNRLKKLTRAGFDAPMTKKAMNIIDQKRLKIVSWR